MITDVILPALGETMDDAKIVRWCKEVGDKVTKGESLFEIETDKATIEVEALENGILRQIVVQEDQRASIGAVVAYLADNLDEPLPEKPTTQPDVVEEKVQTTTPLEAVNEQAQTTRTSRVVASPRARRLADQAGIAISQIGIGTGAKGRIVEADVRRFMQSDPTQQPFVTSVQTQVDAGEDQRISLVGAKKAIAERMSLSARTAPHFFLTTSADMTIAERTRDSWNQQAERSGKNRISMTAIVALACARTLRGHRWVNATLMGDEIILLADIHLGIAVARDDGLIVPVIRNADHKSVRQISDEILDLSERARTGSLKSEQAGKSTFTISNLGMYGIEQFTAIINPPESAILAVGCVKQKFVPSVNGAPEVRPMMKMTLSCDHRVIDGAIGADFLKDLKDLIENPALMLA